jgi:hypothetical protein
MATEYDLLYFLLSHSERHKQQHDRRFAKYIRVRKLLSSLRIPVRGMWDRLSDDQRSRTEAR